MTTAHSFSFTSIEGKPLSMSTFKGKAVLVVNTASECGLTPQYKGLEALWKSRKDKGLVVLGVPSNDFGQQEPGSATEIMLRSAFSVSPEPRGSPERSCTLSAATSADRSSRSEKSSRNSLWRRTLSSRSPRACKVRAWNAGSDRFRCR